MQHSSGQSSLGLKETFQNRIHQTLQGSIVTENILASAFLVDAKRWH